MNGLRVAVIVTILNLVILTLHLVEVRTAAQSVPQVLRGRTSADPSSNAESFT